MKRTPRFNVTRIVPLAGLSSGRLTVHGPSHWEQNSYGKWQLYWRCYCYCGGTCLVEGSRLRSKKTQSCGCITNERISNLNKTHGLRGHAIYKRWHEMLRRCRNPRAQAYHNYGGRGITVDPRWQDFQNFYDDMAAGFMSGLTLERKDNNGPYSKANCIWATYKQQADNRRVNRLITVNGVTKNIARWAESIGRSHSCIVRRLEAGWPIEKVVSP
jgi:hypothetical protein